MRAQIAGLSPPLLTDSRPGAFVRSRAGAYFTAAALGLATVATRAPLAGRYLFDWDSLQFALGMQRFNLGAHRPHPPGYLGYITLGKVAAGLFGGDANSGLVALSIGAEALTVAALFLLASHLMGRFAGLAAALLLLSSPLFWLYGETALTYGLEPGLSLLGFWTVYRAVRADGRGLVLAAVVVGLEGAIRPSAEFFLVPLLCSGVGMAIWNARRRGDLNPGSLLTLAALPLAALGIATAVWLLPLLYLSGGPGPYLFFSAQLAARVSRDSAVWRSGLSALAVNSQAVLAGLALSLGVYLPLLAGIVARVHGQRAGSTRLPRGFAPLAIIWIAPATATFLLIHIGQLAYVLFVVPAVLLPAGLVLERVARLLATPWAGRRGSVTALLLACVGFNLATLLLPSGSLLSQVQARDSHVEALIGVVRAYAPARTVLVTGPEGPHSYRTAMFYLPEYRVIAVGRDRRGRAGEMFSNRPGAPEYDLARFDHVGPLRFPPTGIILVLDDAVGTIVGDPGRLHKVSSGPQGSRLFAFALDPIDPPMVTRSWIYLRSSDHYQYLVPDRPCVDLNRWSCAERHAHDTGAVLG